MNKWHDVLTREEIEKLKYEMYLGNEVSEADEGPDSDEGAGNTMARANPEEQDASDSGRDKARKS